MHKRDWGHAKDYVDAMWLILQQDTPEDYVIATGTTTQVREFIRMSFAELGITIEFEGKDEKEKAYVTSCSNPEYFLKEGKEVVCIDPRYFRPSEVELLIGDASKARTKLGWQPQYDLAALVKEMVEADVELFSKEKLIKDAGFAIKNQFE